MPYGQPTHSGHKLFDHVVYGPGRDGEIDAPLVPDGRTAIGRYGAIPPVGYEMDMTMTPHKKLMAMNRFLEGKKFFKRFNCGEMKKFPIEGKKYSSLEDDVGG